MSVTDSNLHTLNMIRMIFIESISKLIQDEGDKKTPISGYFSGENPHFPNIIKFFPEIRTLLNSKTNSTKQFQQECALISFFYSISWASKMIFDGNIFLLHQIWKKELSPKGNDFILGELIRLLKSNPNEKQIKAWMNNKRLLMTFKLLQDQLERNQPNQWFQLHQQKKYFALEHLDALINIKTSHLIEAQKEIIAILNNPNIELSAEQRLDLEQKSDDITAILDRSITRAVQTTLKQNCLNPDGTMNDEQIKIYNSAAKNLNMELDALNNDLKQCVSKLTEEKPEEAKKLVALQKKLILKIASEEVKHKNLQDNQDQKIAAVSGEKDKAILLLEDTARELTATPGVNPKFDKFSKQFLSKIITLKSIVSPIELQQEISDLAEQVGSFIEENKAELSQHDELIPKISVLAKLKGSIESFACIHPVALPSNHRSTVPMPPVTSAQQEKFKQIKVEITESINNALEPSRVEIPQLYQDDFAELKETIDNVDVNDNDNEVLKSLANNIEQTLKDNPVMTTKILATLLEDAKKLIELISDEDLKENILDSIEEFTDEIENKMAPPKKLNM